ncbi:hypothetical protein PISMIDRAFT_483410 [Pisolithus microcarpus 441]|uniref:Uncharacterized protein n=1 Tax=Pisolithus microcarpus 441 TaxID=765257 RepID=A0A0C9ZU76_9AGAM|nr:hypothetical protein PISMIDRAFT_483410 [Pisolithus microcarpus 441]
MQPVFMPCHIIRHHGNEQGALWAKPRGERHRRTLGAMERWRWIPDWLHTKCIPVPLRRKCRTSERASKHCVPTRTFGRKDAARGRLFVHVCP